MLVLRLRSSDATTSQRLAMELAARCGSGLCKFPQAHRRTVVIVVDSVMALVTGFRLVDSCLMTVGGLKCIHRRAEEPERHVHGARSDSEHTHVYIHTHTHTHTHTHGQINRVLLELQQSRALCDAAEHGVLDARIPGAAGPMVPSRNCSARGQFLPSSCCYFVD